MRKRLVFGCVLALVAALGSPQPASAQTGGDLAVGYSFLSNDQLAANASNLPFGYFFDTSYEVNQRPVARLRRERALPAGHRRVVPCTPAGRWTCRCGPTRTRTSRRSRSTGPRREYCSPLFVGEHANLCQVHIQTASVVGGPRFHLQAGGVRPYFHALFGVARSLRKIGFFAHTATHWAIQPGGGVDIDMTPNTAFRIQADYRLTMYPNEDAQTDLSGTSSLVNPGGEDFKELAVSFGFVVTARRPAQLTRRGRGAGR